MSCVDSLSHQQGTPESFGDDKVDVPSASGINDERMPFSPFPNLPMVSASS